MKLIEDKDRYALKGRVFHQHPRQNTFSHHFDAGVAAHLLVEADAVSDRLPHFLAQQLGHPAGYLPRRNAPRLEHDDPAGTLRQRLQHHQRQHSRFARPRWRHHHHRSTRLHATVQFCRDGGGRKISNGIRYPH